MKIIHILNSNSFSGAENIAISIIENSKFKENSIYASPNGQIKEVLNQRHINFIPLKRVNIMEIRRIIKLVNPDVIHAHDFTTSVISAFATNKVPILSHLHNNPPWIKRLNLYTLVYLLASFRIKKIICVSESVINEYVFSRVIRNKTSIVSNPINRELILNEAKDENENSKLDIIFIGRLTEQKDPINFINVVRKVKDSIPDLKVGMLGEGELKVECERYIEKLGLQNEIKLYGFVNNPYKYLSNSKVLCITSKWEGFGLVAIEAMTLGVPVVAKPVGGLKQIVDESCGRLTMNMDLFEKEVISLLTNDKYYRIKSNSAIKKSNSFINSSVYANTLDQIYLSLIENIKKENR